MTQVNPVRPHLFDEDPDLSLASGVSCSVSETHGYYERMLACEDDPNLFWWVDSEGFIRFHTGSDYEQRAQRDRLLAAIRDEIISVGRNRSLTVAGNSEETIDGQANITVGGVLRIDAGDDILIDCDLYCADPGEAVNYGGWIEERAGKHYFNIARFIAWFGSWNGAIEQRLSAVERSL